MANDLKEKGVAWEISNSLWIGWTFTLGFFNWVSFFYIGTRTKCSKWIGWGMVYFLPFLLAMASGSGSFAFDLATFLTLPMGVMSIIHAFNVRKEYLLRLNAMDRSEKEAEDQLLMLVEEEMSGKSRGKQSSMRGRPTPQKKSQNEAPPPPPPPFQLGEDRRSAAEPPLPSLSGGGLDVDVNNDPPERLARLPGFNELLARKVVVMRQMTGAFRSLEDFRQALELTQDEAEALQPFLHFNSTKSPETPGSPQKQGSWF